MRILNDKEAEERSVGALLYYAMHDRAGFAELEVDLHEELLTDPFLRAMCQGVKASIHEYGQVDMGVLLRHTRPAYAGAAGEIARMIQQYNSDVLIGAKAYYIGRLREFARLRGIADAVNMAVGTLRTGEPTSDELLAKLQGGLLKACGVGTKASHSVTAADVGAECLALWKSQKDKARGISTGLPKLDAVIGGLFPGQLVIVAGRTSEGKSVLLQQISDQAALRGSRVLYANLEMSEYEIWARHLAQQMPCELTPLLRGATEGVQISKTPQQIERANDAFSGSGLRYLHASSLKVSELAGEARRLALTTGLDLITCDYMQLLTPETPSASREREVAQSCRALKVLARELGVPVLVAAQLNRKAVDGDAEENRTPQLHHMRESGALEQDADVGLLIHRPNKAEPETFLLIEKNRNGPRHLRVRLMFEGVYTRFVEAQVQDEEQTEEPSF